ARDGVAGLGDHVREEHREAAGVGGADELLGVRAALAVLEAGAERVGLVGDGAALGGDGAGAFFERAAPLGFGGTDGHGSEWLVRGGGAHTGRAAPGSRARRRTTDHGGGGSSVIRRPVRSRAAAHRSTVSRPVPIRSPAWRR